jgi:hypothetical protein
LKNLCLIAVMFALTACSAGTLTVTDNNGVSKFYRVLDCEMTNKGEVKYKDMLGQTKFVSEPFKRALYENSFNVKHYENCDTCNN